MEGIGSLKYVLQKDNFMGKIDAYLSVLIPPGIQRILLDTDDLPVQIFFVQPGNWTKSFTKISVGLGSDDEKNRYVYHCQLGKTFVMAQVRGYWCHMQIIAKELQTLVFKLDHMVQTLNFLGVLRAFSNIDNEGMQTRALQTS